MLNIAAAWHDPELALMHSLLHLSDVFPFLCQSIQAALNLSVLQTCLPFVLLYMLQ